MVTGGTAEDDHQRLVDQANQIRKKQWLNELELKEIRRSIEEGEYPNVISSEDNQDNRSEEEEEIIDAHPEEHNGRKLTIAEGCELIQEESMLIEELEEISQKEKERLPPLRGIEKKNRER